MKTNTETLISAMRKLAEDIESQDGVANAAIAEAADRLGELQDEVERLKADIKIIRLRDCERDADVIDRQSPMLDMYAHIRCASTQTHCVRGSIIPQQDRGGVSNEYPRLLWHLV